MRSHNNTAVVLTDADAARRCLQKQWWSARLLTMWDAVSRLLWGAEPEPEPEPQLDEEDQSLTAPSSGGKGPPRLQNRFAM